MWFITLCLKFSFAVILTLHQVKPFANNQIFETNIYDKCADMCHKMYPKESLKHEFFGSPRNACQRGCGLVSRIQLHSVESDFSSASRLCQRDCVQIYDFNSERFACNLGCSRRLIPPSSGAPPLDLYPQNSEDIDPDDILLDPALRTQLKVDESPLPRLHIKTLPHHHLQSVEELYQQFMERETVLQDTSVTSHRKYWYDYFITRMVLAAATMLSVVCALWLCLVPQKNEEEDNSQQISHAESQSLKLGDSIGDPPKYSEIDFHSSSPPPPKYSDVVNETETA